jgi:hypothetical protein
MCFLRGGKKLSVDATTSAKARLFPGIGRDLGLTARNLVLVPLLSVSIVDASSAGNRCHARGRWRRGRRRPAATGVIASVLHSPVTENEQ